MELLSNFLKFSKHIIGWDYRQHISLIEIPQPILAGQIIVVGQPDI